VSEPDHLKPFVLPTQPSTVEHHGAADYYIPTDLSSLRPAIIVIHGMLSQAMQPTPRNWPLFQGYGLTSAARGAVGVVVEHGPHTTPDAFQEAASILSDAITVVRADPRVDSERIALWSFSGGGLLLPDYLRDPPPWLRCIAASYPLLGPLPGWPDSPRLNAAAAASGAGSLPILVTRVGLENPAIAATVEAFVAAAPAGLEIIDVPDGHHSFDVRDHTDQSRDAVERAFAWVLARLA
jgi:alpha-beta hydrolase superfamily lysophospholipase